MMKPCRQPGLGDQVFSSIIHLPAVFESGLVSGNLIERSSVMGVSLVHDGHKPRSWYYLIKARLIEPVVLLNATQ